MSDNIKILIVGSGFISNEYLKVISNYKLDCVVVGRGKENILKLQSKFKGIKFYSGGLEKFLQSNSINKFTHFINLVNSLLNCKVEEKGAEKYIIHEFSIAMITK